MGIKTKFNPMGGRNNEKGKLSDWRYSTASNGQITLYEYLGQYSSTKPVYVPVKKGKTVINNYTSGSTTTASNTPFYNNPSVISVDLQNVPWVSNSMYKAFNDCRSLISVKGINQNVIDMDSTFQSCYSFNQPITIPDSVTSMVDTFWYCKNFNQPITIGNSVTNMSGTFYDCYNFNQNIQIPNSVTNMHRTFASCTNFNQPITIPNSVTNMYYTFYGCSNFNQPITIPNSVTSVASTFSGCTNFNQPTTIPNSVTNMSYTFSDCKNFNQPITIGNSVTDTIRAFSGCYNFNQPITIPNSVTNMEWTFSGCYNFNQPITIGNSVTDTIRAFSGCKNLQETIAILSANISDTSNCFNGSGLAKNVIFPLRYINNVNTATRNSLVTAETGGYAVGTAVGNLVNNTAQNAVFYAYDPIAWEGYNTWTGNGTHWILSKWAGIGKTAATTDVVVTQEITSYDTFPTAVARGCFAGNTVINSLTIKKSIPWESNTAGAFTNGSTYTAVGSKCTGLTRADVWVNDWVTAGHTLFKNCTNLQYANIQLSNNSASAARTFAMCSNLVSANTGTSFKSGVGDVDIPDIVTNCVGFYEQCKSLHTMYFNGMGITDLSYAVDYCNTRDLNIYIKSPNVTTVTNFQRGYVATRAKNLYIPFMNSDGTYTKTHNAFNAAVYLNNASSGYYRHDTSPYNSVADWVVTVASPNLYLNTYRGISTTPTTVTTSPFAGNTVYLLPSTYTANAALTYVDCNNVPFAGTTMLGAFKSCLNLQGVDNINVPSGVTTAQNMFYDCRELRSAHVNLPASCTTATLMFLNCKNCTDFVLNAPGLTTMTNCFTAINSQPLNVTMTSPNITTITNMFRQAVTTQRKNIYIYYKYSNGSFTTTYTKMNIAQYAGTSGLSNSASPKYNSTGNYYVYDLTAKYQDTNVANILNGFTYTQSGSTYNLTKYTGGAYARVPKKEQVKLYPDSTSTTTYGVDTVIYNNCFNNARSLVSVDLQKVPFISNSMYNAFYHCQNLTSVTGINQNVTSMTNTFCSCFNLNQNIQIPNSVTSMTNTFRSCINLNQNIQIPNSVTSMAYTFYYCNNLNQNIQIPNSVTNMHSTFTACHNFNQNIQIPNSVTDMSGTFSGCSNLNQNIRIGNSVTNMAYTFSSCSNLNQNIRIGNSVTNMAYTFDYCRKLDQNIQIPNSVTNMYYTFFDCFNLQGTINILSNQIINASGCFQNTVRQKNVHIPFKYSNGVNSATFNSFVSAGYLTSAGASTGQNGVTVYDLNA